MAPTQVPVDDSLTARVTPTCPDDIRNILYHAWGHDLTTLKTLLDDREKASVQDPTTGETPLHAAIRACGPAIPKTAEADQAHGIDKENDNNGGDDDDDDDDTDGKEEAAREILQELFFSGAIWNDVDANNETPGCVAARLGRTSLYEMCVDAGVRAELLLAVMDGYEELLSAGDEAAAAADVVMQEDGDEAPELVASHEEQPSPQDGEEKDKQEKHDEEQSEPAAAMAAAARFVPPNTDDKPVTSEQYLACSLTYDASKLLDADLNGVMMAWETDIMRRSVAALLPASSSSPPSSPEPPSGKRILNIGFGMGIIDGMFAALKPSVHHIIEAHPSVLEHVRQPGSHFGPSWEASGPADGAYRVLPGRWQDVAQDLLAQGQLYDAVYFDTFGEDYAQLKLFFTEYVPALLDQEGRFSFFNGLGADRRICYDVYTKVVEMHCADAGLDVEWEVSDVDMSALDSDGKGEWEGVRRRYWTLDKYRLPICTFMG